MKAITVILHELAALFIDDGALVVLAVAWIAACAWVLPLVLPPPGSAALLFAGLAAALAFSVMRA